MLMNKSRHHATYVLPSAFQIKYCLKENVPAHKIIRQMRVRRSSCLICLTLLHVGSKFCLSWSFSLLKESVCIPSFDLRRKKKPCDFDFIKMSLCEKVSSTFKTSRGRIFDQICQRIPAATVPHSALKGTMIFMSRDVKVPNVPFSRHGRWDRLNESLNTHNGFTIWIKPIQMQPAKNKLIL